MMKVKKAFREKWCCKRAGRFGQLLLASHRENMGALGDDFMHLRAATWQDVIDFFGKWMRYCPFCGKEIRTP